MSDRLSTTANKRQNLDSTFRVNPLQSRGFVVQARSEESTPATKAQLWESYQQAKQLNQNGANLPIQAKLTIGQPGEKYEQEADSVAERVMAMPEQKLSKSTVTNSVQQNRSSIEPIQRVCTDCQEEPKEESKPEEDGDRSQAKEGLGQTSELTSVRRKLDSADDSQSGSNSDSQFNGGQGKSILAISDRSPAQIQRAPDKMPPPTGTTTINKQNETISASGNTLTEAITNLTSQGKGEAGRVTCAPDLDKQAWQADENKPAAIVVTANVTVTETKAMPVWTELDRQCEPVKKEWARFYQALDRHEEGHIKIDETSFQDLHKKLLGKTPAIADEIYNTTVTQANTKNDAYDATTQHGLTQGTAVTPVQCQAMEKVSDNQQSDGEGAEVQAKFSDSVIQRVADDNPSVEPDLESRLGSSKGGGSPLSNEVRSFMEPRFGADFSGVRVHTGSNAVQMNRDVNAQAFAHGSDIYFGAGKAPGKDVLTAHELTHVVQQKLSPKIQCFAGSEHKKLGDKTNITLDLGSGVILSWGDVVAIAGDEFGSLDDLIKQVETPEGKAQIRFALENAGIPGEAVKTLPAPTDEQKSQGKARYVNLAAQNVSHFAAGGTALENWQKYHADAVDKALRAGLEEDSKQLNLAYLSEAFGQHYLTDMFSGGHIRTPRKQIIDWYTGTFAPNVIDKLINNLRTRMVDEVYQQVSTQSLRARIFETRARYKITTALNQKMNEAISKLDGGRDRMIQYLGLAIAGIVSGSIHDMEGKRGVMVSSKDRPEPWKAMGDGGLDSKENETNKAQAETAILTALQDVNTAYQIGLREKQTKDIVPQSDKLPSLILFGFNSDTLTPAAQANLVATGAYMIHNPTAHLDLVGHTDPIGKEDDNQNLGLRRAMAIAVILSNQGIAASQFSTSSQGEKQLIETNPRRYSQNRRVEFTWASQAPSNNDTSIHNIAYDRAQDAAKNQIGPPYKQVERLLPEAAPGQNIELPDWHWGSLPPDFQQEIGNWVKGYLDKEMQTKILSNKELDPQVVSDNKIEPRPIVANILQDLLKNPVDFLSTCFGTAAQSKSTSNSVNIVVDDFFDRAK